MSSSSGSEPKGQRPCSEYLAPDEMSRDAGVSEKLTHQEIFEEAGKQGRILGRDDVYRSGPRWTLCTGSGLSSSLK